MAGIYIHIPFCKQACHYCNFHFSTSLIRKNDFVAALLEEIDQKKGYLGGEPVDTIYFGGGTPSLLSDEELKRIMERVRATFSVDPAAEVTLEANPDDVTMPGKLEAWRAGGINRLSIGIQSFFEEDLQWMNRAHTAGQAVDSIKMAKGEGFDNISIDLIYGSPTLTDDHWAKNVEQAVNLHIPHLSCYALTVEPRTALDKMIRQHKKAPVDPDTQARQFLLLMDWLERAGYEHYEISNFALPGKRSRHNSSYWQGKKYLGLGPSAHSYDGISRQWNVANNGLYINALAGEGAADEVAGGATAADRRSGAAEVAAADDGSAGKGQALFERELLTPVQQLNEYIMISLRTMEGCDTGYVSAKFGEAAARELIAGAARYVREGKMRIEYPGMQETGQNEEMKVNGQGLESGQSSETRETGQRLVLTREGKLLADGIAAELFVVKPSL